jgi:hypothetical protein
VAIALMMEAVSTSETLVNFYQTTRRNIPEDSHLHTRRDNLKSYLISLLHFFIIMAAFTDSLALRQIWGGGAALPLCFFIPLSVKYLVRTQRKIFFSHIIHSQKKPW